MQGLYAWCGARVRRGQDEPKNGAEAGEGERGQGQRGKSDKRVATYRPVSTRTPGESWLAPRPPPTSTSPLIITTPAFTGFSAWSQSSTPLSGSDSVLYNAYLSAARTCPPVPPRGASPPPSPIAKYRQTLDSMTASPLTTPRPSISQQSAERRESGQSANGNAASSIPAASSPALGLPTALKPVGIVNEQNTCFLNSTFQAVSLGGDECR